MSTGDNRGPQIEAIFWDFGGVFTTSPFVAFNRYETLAGIPKDFIRTVNATNSDTNAWAKLERNEVTIEEFCQLFEEEALALGFSVDGRAVLSCIAGEVRPNMVRALRILTKRYKTACLTNNFGPENLDGEPSKVKGNLMKHFHIVVM